MIKGSAHLRSGCCCWHPATGPYCINKDPTSSKVLICMEVHGVAHSKLHLNIRQLNQILIMISTQIVSN